MNSLNTILTTLQSSIAGNVSAMTSPVLKLAATIFVISIALRFLQEMAEERFNIVPFCLYAALKGGGWAFLIKEYPSIVDEWLKGCLWVGSQVGGGSASIEDLMNPSRIINIGISLYDPLFVTIKNLSGTDIITTGILLSLIYILCIFSFFIIAWQILITLVEFYLLMAPSLVLLSFGPWQKTAFLAEMGLKGITGIGVKVMVLSSVINVIFPLLTQFKLTNADLPNSLVMLACTFGIALLTWFAPSMAAGLMSGSPQLSVGTAVGAAASAASTIQTIKSLAGSFGGNSSSAPSTASSGKDMSLNGGSRSNSTDTGGSSSSSAASSSNLSNAANRISKD